MKKSKRYIKKQSKESLINKKVLNKIINTSDICKYAIRELNIAGFNDKSDEFNTVMYNQVIEAVAVFASHRNSGFSAHCEIELTKKLCNFEIISPLTFKDNEWNLISNNEGYQNKRNSAFFKEKDGSIYYLYAYSNRVIKSKYFGTNEMVDNNSNCCWNSSFWLTDNNIITGEYIKRCILHKEDILEPYIPKETIYLNCTEIEVAKDNWLMFVDKNSKEYIELISNYDIIKDTINSIKGININDLTFKQAETAEKEIINN